MSVVTRCGAVSVLLGLLTGAAPALAQTETSGSSWTDPPLRGAAGPEAPAVPAKPAAIKPDAPADAIKPAQQAAAPPSPTPAERAETTLGVKPVEASARSAQTHRAVVRPRMVERPLVIARRPARIVERSIRRPTRHASRRAIHSYAFVPERRSYGRAASYDGRSTASTWSGRRLAGWGGLIEENRASRIARAREAGYTVMRMRTYEYPDGNQIQRLSPLDDGRFDNLD